VRFRAASALARKPGDFVPQLTRMLAGDNLNARLGACEALEYLKDKAAPATDELLKQLSQKDEWLSIRASYALAGIGGPARKAVPELLRLVLADQKGDPRATKRRYLGMALFMSGYADNAPRRGLLADSLEGVDRQMLYPAVKRMLEIDDGLARSQMAAVYGKLSNEELDKLWPDIVRAVERPAPSGEMFADGIREAGLQLLAKHHIKEGMRVCIDYAKNQNPWASESRMGRILSALKLYGAAAKELLPDLKDLATLCRNERDFPEDCKKKKTAAVEDAIKAIEAATDRPDLRSIAPMLQKADGR
jgi:tetratricopeptide (TPR) repeat protein